MLRLFIAVELQEEIRKNISAFIDTLREQAGGVNWARVESLHLTLKFIGEAAHENLGPIKRIMRETAGSYSSCEITIRETGVFPNWKSPRVFWTGVKEEKEILKSMAAVFDEKLEPLGIKKENREFVPHLTLGRSRKDRGMDKKELGNIQALFERESHDVFGTQGVSEIVLMKSILTNNGVFYETIHREFLKP